eukprot:TRINITY_DN30544_c0_g1_i1.p1 TRINITY_DN30544_c0_g1~~TRINITY_DN30544_c0_g1_i1.p1  ORF type:complete len:156 (-),score=49.86 TRINITY_DN30544_c0_g1_i1:154-621(-)
MSFSKNLALLACGVTTQAAAATITVNTANSTKNSLTDAQKATVIAGLTPALQQYTGFGSCSATIVSAAATNVTNVSNMYDWKIEVGAAGGTLCTDTLASAAVAVSGGDTFKNKYNENAAATAISGKATSVTGISSVSGLSAMVASAAAAVMLMVL